MTDRRSDDVVRGIFKMLKKNDVQTAQSGDGSAAPDKDAHAEIAPGSASAPPSSPTAALPSDTPPPPTALAGAARVGAVPQARPSGSGFKKWKLLGQVVFYGAFIAIVVVTVRDSPFEGSADTSTTTTTRRSVLIAPTTGQSDEEFVAAMREVAPFANESTAGIVATAREICAARQRGVSHAAVINDMMSRGPMSEFDADSFATEAEAEYCSSFVGR